MRILFTIIAMIFVSTTAQAALILHISPDGASGTRWEFSGSTVALSAGSNNSFWGENSGTLANTTSGGNSILTGSGTISSTSFGALAIIDVWASEHTFDGVSVRTTLLNWNAGDTISWSGDLTSGLLFANLNIGSVTTNSIIGTDITESLTITVSNTALNAVSEPTTIAILALGLVGLGFARRKKA